MESPLISFFTKEYLEGFIKEGGSKVKLLTSNKKEVVTGTLKSLVEAGTRAGYASAYVDVASVAKINVFSHLYQAAVHGLDLGAILCGYHRRVLEGLGYVADDVPPGTNFVSWASSTLGRVPEILCKEIRTWLEKDLFHNRFINRSFAAVVMHLVADKLGVKGDNLTQDDRELLFSWLRGQEIPLRDLRRFHVFKRINRYNARLMLHSLAEMARLAGKSGLLLVVDGLEFLLARQEGRALYGQAARDEFYESIRQMIDSTDTLAYLMVVLGFTRELVDDERRGLRSYEALWLRIQHEVSGKRANLFRDFLDLDEVLSDVEGR